MYHHQKLALTSRPEMYHHQESAPTIRPIDVMYRHQESVKSGRWKYSQESAISGS